MFSVGHSTHPLAQLIALLEQRGVSRVADVRVHPGSARMPWFDREALSRTLPEAGVDYVHVPQLGGRRRPRADSSNTGWKVGGFRGYADHMDGAEFADGLNRLEALAREGPTAMMCAEGLWWRCHRRLIADALTVRGWEVAHISPGGQTSAHELTEFAVVDGTRIRYPPAQAALELG